MAEYDANCDLLAVLEVLNEAEWLRDVDDDTEGDRLADGTPVMDCATADPMDTSTMNRIFSITTIAAKISRSAVGASVKSRAKGLRWRFHETAAQSSSVFCCKGC